MVDEGHPRDVSSSRGMPTVSAPLPSREVLPNVGDPLSISHSLVRCLGSATPCTILLCLMLRLFLSRGQQFISRTHEVNRRCCSLVPVEILEIRAGFDIATQNRQELEFSTSSPFRDELRLVKVPTLFSSGIQYCFYPLLTRFFISNFQECGKRLFRRHWNF